MKIKLKNTEIEIEFPFFYRESDSEMVMCAINENELYVVNPGNVQLLKSGTQNMAQEDIEETAAAESLVLSSKEEFLQAYHVMLTNRTNLEFDMKRKLGSGYNSDLRAIYEKIKAIRKGESGC